jgi:hypothetical protein
MPTIDFHSLLDAGSTEESHAPVALNGRELQELVSPLSRGLKLISRVLSVKDIHKIRSYFQLGKVAASLPGG